MHGDIPSICTAALARNGVDITGAQYLGAGYFGFTHLLHDGRVIKYIPNGSYAQEDIEVSVWMLKHRKSLPTLLPRIDKVFQGMCVNKYGYPEVRPTFIVRESLNDFPRSDHYMDPLLHKAADLAYMGVAYRNARRQGGEDLESAKARVRRTRADFIRIAKGLEQNSAFMLNYGPKWAANVLRGLDWMVVRGVGIQDLLYKPENWGIRPGTNDLVIRDIGSGTVPTFDMDLVSKLDGLRSARKSR